MANSQFISNNRLIEANRQKESNEALDTDFAGKHLIAINDRYIVRAVFDRLLHRCSPATTSQPLPPHQGCRARQVRRVYLECLALGVNFILFLLADFTNSGQFICQCRADVWPRSALNKMTSRPVQA